MKFLYFLIVESLLCFPSVGFSQDTSPKLYVIGQVTDARWLTQDARDLLDTMHLKYTAPANFDEIAGIECFRDQPKLWGLTLSCIFHELRSKDKEFVAFFTFYKPFGKSDSIRMGSLFKTTYDLIDKQHIAHIKGNIRGSLGEAAIANWKDHVLYLPSEEAHQKFNADTVIQVPIKLDSATFYRGKYNHFDALYLQKKGRGFLTFYTFYTDKAKKKLTKYQKEIEGIFRYRD